MTRTNKSSSTKEQSEKLEVAENVTTIKKSRKKTEPKKTETKQSRVRVIRKKTEHVPEDEMPEDETPVSASANNAAHQHDEKSAEHPAEHPAEHRAEHRVANDEPDKCSDQDAPDKCSDQDAPDESSEQDKPDNDSSEESLEEDEQINTLNGKPSSVVNQNSRPSKDFGPLENDTQYGKVYKMDHRQEAPHYTSSNNRRHTNPYNNRGNDRGDGRGDGRGNGRGNGRGDGRGYARGNGRGYARGNGRWNGRGDERENGRGDERENERENRQPRREYTNSERSDTLNSCLKFSYKEVIQKLENDRCGDLTIDDHVRYLIAQTHQNGKPILNTIFKQIYQAMNHEAAYPVTAHQIRGAPRHQKTEYGGPRNHRDVEYGDRVQSSQLSRVHDM